MTSNWSNPASGFCSASHIAHSVYGQLEPPSIRSKPGWRYLQCTDIPNECKVLLPPNTSKLYEQLLNAEIVARRDAPRAEYEEIFRIKNHIIKKCLKLRGKPVSLKNFVEIHAPEDFGSRRLQRWANVAANRTTRSASTKPLAGDLSKSQEAPNSTSAPGRLMRKLSSSVRGLRPQDPDAAQTKSIRHKRSQSSQKGARNMKPEGEMSDCPDRKPGQRDRSLLRKRRPNNQSKQSDSEQVVKPQQSSSFRRPSTTNTAPAQPSSKREKAKDAAHKQEKGQPRRASHPTTYNTEFYILADGARSSTISQVTPINPAPVATFSVPSNSNFSSTRTGKNLGFQSQQPMNLPGFGQVVNTSSSVASSTARQHSARQTGGRLKQRAYTVPFDNAQSASAPQAFQSQAYEQRQVRNRQNPQPKSRSGEGQASKKPSQQQSYYPYPTPGGPSPIDPIQRPPNSTGKRRSTIPESSRQQNSRSAVGPPSSTPLPPEFHRWIEEQAAVQGYAKSASVPAGIHPAQVSPPTPILPGQRGVNSPVSPSFPQPIYSAEMLRRHDYSDDSDFSLSPSLDSPRWRDEGLAPITPEASQYSLPQSRDSKVSDPVIPDLAYLEIADLHQRQQCRDLNDSRLTYYPDSSAEELNRGTANDVQPADTASGGIQRTPSRSILVTGGSRPASRNSVRSNRSVSFAFSPHQDARNHVRDCEADKRTKVEELLRQEIWRKHKPGDPEVERRYQKAQEALREAEKRLWDAEEEYQRRYPRNGEQDEEQDEEPYFETTYV